MKKLLRILIFSIVLCAALCIAVSAADSTYMDDNFIEWKISVTDYTEPVEDGDYLISGTATITGLISNEYTKSGFHMPSYVTYNDNTYVVTSIAQNAFSGNSLVFGELTLPEKLRTIGSNAFNKTRIYGDIVIPESVETISSGAFKECYGILTVTLPSSIQAIESSTFYRCYSLTAVIASQNLKGIGDSAFYECHALNEIPLGAGTLEIGSSAFLTCKALAMELDLSTLNKLGADAFKNCLTLEKVIMPNNVSYNSSVFSGCTSLKEFKATDSSAYYAVQGGVLFSKDMTTLYRYPVAKSGYTYSVPETVKTVYADAFYNVTTLTSITLPNGVTTIQNNAFRNTSVESFFIPDSVTSIGSYVLADCPKLTWVVLGSKINSASNIVSGSAKVTLLISRNNSFSTSGTGISNNGKCYKVSEYVCSTHFYGYVDIEPTCTESGLKVCVVCDDILYARPLGHDGPIIEKSELTCTTDSYVVVDCTRCGEDYAKTVYQTCKGHTGKTVTVNQSNTTVGYTIVFCTTCNQTVVDNFSSSFYTLGDINKDGKIDSKDVDLLGKYIGNVNVEVNKLACDINLDKVVDIYDLLLLKRFIEKIDAELAPSSAVCERHMHIGQHSYKDTINSCTAVDVTVSFCLDCGTITDTAISEPEGHNWETIREFAPTCTDTGFKSIKCSVCGLANEIKYEKVDHIGTWWTIPNQKGVQYRYCDICNAFESQAVDYSDFDELISQLSPNYTKYYNDATLSLLKPVVDNHSGSALTQAQVDENVALLKDILPRIEYKLNEIPTIYITTDGSQSLVRNMPYIGAEIAVAYVDDEGVYHDIVERFGEMKVRGNSTAGHSAKQPYNIKFTAEVDLFGLGKDNKYCLMANAYDPAFIRNCIARELDKSILEDYSCDYEFVEVYCDGVFKGTYMLSTPVDIEETRINLDKNEDFILEIEWNDGGIRDDSALYIQTPYTNFRVKIDSHDVEDITSDGYAALYTTLMQAEFAVMSGDWEQIQKYYDVESLAKYYILQEYLKDVDYAWDSTRFAIEDGRITAGPAWDFDRAMGHSSTAGGNANCRDAYYNSSKKPSVGGIEGDSTTGTWANALYNGIPNEQWIHNPTSSNWIQQNGNHNWFTFLYMYSPEFMELVSEYVWELRDELRIIYENIYDDLGNKTWNYIDSIYFDPDIYSAITRNYTVQSLYSAEGFKYGSWKAALDDLRLWLQKRHQWMLEFYCSDYLAAENADNILLDKFQNEYYNKTTTEFYVMDNVIYYDVYLTVPAQKIEDHHSQMYVLISDFFSNEDLFTGELSDAECIITFYYDLGNGEVLQFVNGSFVPPEA